MQEAPVEGAAVRVCAYNRRVLKLNPQDRFRCVHIIWGEGVPDTEYAIKKAEKELEKNPNGVFYCEYYYAGLGEWRVSHTVFNMTETK